MRVGKLVGWGIVIYAVVGLAAAFPYRYGIDAASSLPARIFILAALVVVALVAARSLRLHCWHDILPYSAGWMLVCASLDAIYVVPFAGSAIYLMPDLWVGYALVVSVPLITPYMRKPLEFPHVS